jgi:hypothetical protein
MNARTALVRRRSSLALLAIIAACTPFSASVDDGAVDGGGSGGGAQRDAATADDGAVVVPGVDAASSAPDATVSSDGAVSPIVDAGGPIQYADGGFCAGFVKPIYCFDFDETPTGQAPGLTLSETSGGFTYPPTFTTGSLPRAMSVEVTTGGGRAVGTSPTIDLSQYKGVTLQVELKFDTTTPATAIQYIARLNFTHQSSNIAFNAANGLTCLGTTYANLNPGVHHVVITVPVQSDGTAISNDCIVDGMPSAGAATVAPSQTLAVEIGNDSSGAPFNVEYDDVVIRLP